MRSENKTEILESFRMTSLPFTAIRFSGTSGSDTTAVKKKMLEGFKLHTEGSWDSRVGKNWKESIGGNFSSTVEGNASETYCGLLENLNMAGWHKQIGAFDVAAVVGADVGIVIGPKTIKLKGLPIRAKTSITVGHKLDIQWGDNYEIHKSGHAHLQAGHGAQMAPAGTVQIAQLTQIIQAVNQEVADLSREVNTLTEDIARLDVTCQRSTRTVGSVEETAESVQRTVAQLDSTIGEFNAKIQTLNADIASKANICAANRIVITAAEGLQANILDVKAIQLRIGQAMGVLA